MHYARARNHDGDPQAERLPRVNHGTFRRTRPSAQAWYWVGFIAADGCVTERQTLLVRLAGQDLDHLHVLRAFVGAGAVGSASGRISGPASNGSFCLQIASSQILEDLARLGGIRPRKSLAYVPPASAATQAAFWLGMLDGDGTVYWHKSPSARTPRGRPQLMWLGTADAMHACFDFWQARLPATVSAPRQRQGVLWELRLSSSMSVLAAKELLRACSYSLPRKRCKLREAARYVPARRPSRRSPAQTEQVA
jgi:hypothetical protein